MKKNVRSSKKVYKRQAFPKAIAVRSKFPKISLKPGSRNYADLAFIYSSRFSINPPTLGVAGVYQFNLGSLYDPDVTGVGTQPIPFDQYAAIYERYQVVEAEYKVVLNNPTTYTIMCGAMVSDSNAATTDPERLLQNGQGSWDLMTPAAGSKDSVVFTGCVDLAAVHGKTRMQYLADDDYSSVMTTGPTESAFLNIWCCDHGTGDPGAIACAIEIRFKARLIGSQLIVTS